MKTTSIDVLMSSAEGALVRLLGLVGRRGYGVMSVQARTSECGSSTHVQLHVTGDRPAALLLAQINKLYDVRSAQMAETAAVTTRSDASVPAGPGPQRARARVRVA